MIPMFTLVLCAKLLMGWCLAFCNHSGTTAVILNLQDGKMGQREILLDR